MIITRNKHMVNIEEELNMNRENDEIAAGSFSSVYAPKWLDNSQLILTTLQLNKSIYLKAIYEKHGFSFEKIKTKVKKAQAYKIPRLKPFTFTSNDKDIVSALYFINEQIGWCDTHELFRISNPSEMFKAWFVERNITMNEKAIKVYHSIFEAFEVLKNNCQFLRFGVDLSDEQFVISDDGKLLCIDLINFK